MFLMSAHVLTWTSIIVETVLGWVTVINVVIIPTCFVSIELEERVGMVVRGVVVAQRSEHQRLKLEALGSIPGGLHPPAIIMP